MDRFLEFLRTRPIFVLLLWSSVMFLTDLGGARLWDRDEPRNARCAQEMWESGNWIVPTFNGELRTHKPVMLYWLQIAAYQVFGPTEFAARLGSALAAIGTTFCVYYLTSRLIDRVTGLWAGIAVSSSLMFVVAGRAATPDACLIFFSTLGIAVIASGIYRLRDDIGDGQRSIFRRLSLPEAVIGYAAWGGAILSKGPVGIILPLAVVGLWRLLGDTNISKEADADSSLLKSRIVGFLNRFSPRQILHCITDLRVILGGLISLAVAAPWYIAVGVQTDGEWLYGFLFEHNLQRAMAPMEGHGGFPGYYIGAMLVGLFPWSLFAFPIAVWAWKENRDPSRAAAVRLGLIWMAVYIGLFSIAKTKLPSYITPCYAGAAILVGGFFRSWASRGWSQPMWLKTVAMSVICLVALGISISLGVAGNFESIPNLISLAWIPIALFSVGLAGLLSRNSDSLGNLTLNSTRWPIGFAIASGFTTVMLVGIGPQLLDRQRSDLDMIVDYASQNPNASWMALGTMEPSWVFYANSPMIEDLNLEVRQPEIGAQKASVSSDWRIRAITHLESNSNACVVTRPELADELVAVGKQTDSEFGLDLRESSQVFLKDEQLVIITKSVPLVASKRKQGSTK